MVTDYIADFLSRSNELTLISFSILLLAFIASGLILVPRVILCVLAGAAFGLVAIPIALPGTTIGALIAFLIARFLGANHVQRFLGRGKLLRRISTAVDQEGWRVVALTRFGAPVPACVANYLFGLTKIHWWPYTWATFVFCAPQVVLFVCLGAAGRAAILRDSMSLLSQVMIALGVITSALIIYIVAKRARLASDALLDGHSPVRDFEVAE